jgi:molybdopterin synthase sulfur carrier subunit
MKIAYLAWLKDKVGKECEEVALPPEVTDVGGLVRWLAGRDARYAAAFEFAEVIKVAVNQRYANDDHPLKPDDEVIFIPPISGG